MARTPTRSPRTPRRTATMTPRRDPPTKSFLEHNASNVAFLQSLERRDLQVVAKQMGVRANVKVRPRARHQS